MLQNRGLGCSFFQNKFLLTSVSISFIAQMCLIYLPFMQMIFQTEALPLKDLFHLLGLAAVSFTLHEFRRRFERSLAASNTTYIRVTDELA